MQETWPSDASYLQSRMQELIQRVDSSSYAHELTWAEHVVLVHQLVEDRLPTPAELFLFQRFRADAGLSRSALVSIVLRGAAPGKNRRPVLSLYNLAWCVRGVKAPSPNVPSG